MKSKIKTNKEIFEMVKWNFTLDRMTYASKIFFQFATYINIEIFINIKDITTSNPFHNDFRSALTFSKVVLKQSNWIYKTISMKLNFGKGTPSFYKGSLTWLVSSRLCNIFIFVRYLVWFSKICNYPYK